MNMNFDHRNLDPRPQQVISTYNNILKIPEIVNVEFQAHLSREININRGRYKSLCKKTVSEFFTAIFTKSGIIIMISGTAISA